ncbi:MULTISPECIES: hypothetical protein [unclassified Leeuwenhoekiella]|uniref:hypothetical protein n=1 Tax=unclassified Leeuwenhoekiella TaxID=2615029 RepID=UPI000C5FF49B|nr:MULTISPECIES: hypothetical protein [unclassified Leeuwenhoekiella]MAW94587.1 hypothetical protein [Leeuwenhoekiella sp.]MBA82010.1 hypothetical protein [Leeuwenhoekiella sp.]|tara:strand:+ start:13002 stop:13292 length:291 start_codon:yes stop_codon:yes gene_type:complete
MSELLERVESLQKATGTLISRHKQLQQQLQVLAAENAQLKEENAQLKKLVENWEAKYSTLKTANAMLGSNDYKRETKLKINAMMREIDACIAQLAD